MTKDVVTRKFSDNESSDKEYSDKESSDKESGDKGCTDKDSQHLSLRVRVAGLGCPVAGVFYALHLTPYALRFTPYVSHAWVSSLLYYMQGALLF